MAPSSTQPACGDVQMRARCSRGISNDAILRMVRRAIDRRGIGGDSLVDVGCGQGNLFDYVYPHFPRYIGVDAVRYESFPAQAEFRQLDLDTQSIPLADGSADVVSATEVIEHLENPREFMRKLVRLAKPGGWIIVTTPNQLSLLSLVTLVFRKRFQAFQDVHYPAHLTALLEIDLRRIALECGLTEVEFEYSLESRIPLTGVVYPAWLARLFPRALSDNILLVGRKPLGS